MFNATTYKARRSALLEKMKGESGIILFLGNTEAPMQYRDNCYKWRQDSNFLYFFGIDAPLFAATLDLDSGEQTIYADDCDIDDIIWNGPTPTVKETAATTGIDITAPLCALKPALQGRKVHFLPATRNYTAIWYSELLGQSPRSFFCASKAGCPAASAPLVQAVISLRLVKSAEEIAVLDDACNLGYQMHTVARKGIVPGRIEQEVVARMEAVAAEKGWGISFPTILTQHGEVFHCHSHLLEIAPGRMMVVDAGVENNEHYASDFTRTYPTAGVFTQKQKDIYSIVCDCNNLAFSLIRPGVEYREVHLATVRYMLERLQNLGIVNAGDSAQMAADGIGGLFMPHGLGHNMGLDVHDMEDLGEDNVGYDPGQKRSHLLGLASLRMARSLRPGNVVTDEPGIYFIPALIEQWKAAGTDKGAVNYAKLREYYDFGGIRLEDDVLVTEDGARRLGAKRLPITPEEVEEAMKKDKEDR